MNKTFILVSGLLVVFVLNSLHINAEAPPKLSPECIKKMEKRDEQFTSLIMSDVISSFDLDIDEHSYIEVTSRDLDAANMIYGGKEKDDYYNSLMQHFNVASRGKPRLFIKPQEAYLLYKEPDYTDVMIHLELKGSKWEVIDQKKKKGNEIEYKQIKCEKEYIKKKKEYYSK
ncbi:hypothetical protein [Metabacillus litoralis]|uniref:hypothetical protein n=1 Tax=Metabacillus litoralis TaxID=152268 RepID=UPI001CFC64E9|nr:hypothetical protein [Metabacillus litoralis]